MTNEALCQTCKHEKGAHTDFIGACCVETANEWCSCVQFVPIEPSDHDAALDEAGRLDELAGARPVDWVADDWAKEHALKWTRRYFDKEDHDYDLVSEFFEAAIREVLAKAAVVALTSSGDANAIAESILALGAKS